jgi:hypothetical protein
LEEINEIKTISEYIYLIIWFIFILCAMCH